MQTLKDRKPLLIKILAVVLLVLLCCNLPSLLFWPLCLKQDRDIPPNTEVIVSACKRPYISGVPGGEVLFVREVGTDKMYLVDLRTGETREVPNDPLLFDHGIFLSSELVWLGNGYTEPGDPGYRPNYILDLSDGQRYELLDMTWLPRLDDNKFDAKYYSYFTGAEQVFIHHSQNTLIALSPDFRQHPEGNVIISQYALASNAEEGEMLEQLMEDLEVDYEIVDFSLNYVDVPSPMGRYIVRSDGIYLSGTNTPVVTREMASYFKGWYYDESGVVFREVGYDLIDFIPESGGLYHIPSPVLKLYLPAP
jgi:hypothetical protein